MWAGHYSSPGGGGRGRRILVHYDQLDLITPIRLCNIITSPTPPHPAHTHTHTHTHAHTRTRTQTPKQTQMIKKILRFLSKQHAYTH